MCGIAGIVALDPSSPPTTEALRRMCETLVHRGPDDEGIHVADGVGLGMRRLAIIDLAGGAQPLFNEDRSVRVVFNGEIYNYRELADDLRARGHRLASATDGEVIAHLWEEHGPDFLSHLNGMFAIALHDSRQRRLLLARDRVGIKPLFWARTDRHIVFGSEVKALLASGRIEREIDLDALGQFLSWEYVPAPATLFRGVQKLEAASLLDIDLESGNAVVRDWWKLRRPQDSAATDEEWESRVAAKLRECVERQLVADVPLGAFLSGGVDSSLIAAAMGEVSTFSIGFDDPSYNELPWSEKVSRHLGTRHRTEVIQPDALQLFDRLMHFMDDPIGDFSIFPTYLVSRMAREDVTVVLSGDGGDELFGGYETYVAQEKARLWRRIPGFVRRGLIGPALRAIGPGRQKKGWLNKARRFAEGAAYDEGLGHARWRLFAGQALRETLLTPEALRAMPTPPESHVEQLFEEAGERSELDRGLYVDLKSYLVDNCLVKVDRMSMACSLEARVPFLDHELVELAFCVPDRLKLDGAQTKPLLKRIAACQLPPECVYRPKEGFSIPIKHWLFSSMATLTEELLDAGRIRREGIFRVESVERLKSEHRSGRENHSHILWSLIVFQEWRRRWAG